ncbi:YitT family protein [Acinetobacter wanghuae]|uniref:YitT family protein n=1 Tax=Acinetobacter wanghuae TaxID=2662362 RepID=UPI003AF785E3
MNNLRQTAVKMHHLETRHPLKHSYMDDSIALFSGTLFVGITLILYEQAGLLTGSTAGIAFVIHYATGWSFSLVYFLINLPFYWFAWRYLGRAFALKTFICVGMLALMTFVVPRYLHIDYLHPMFASIAGGLMLGTGILFLARHQSSLGGATIISLYLQEKFAMSAGKVQMWIDCIVVAFAFGVMPYQQVLWSILAAIIMGVFLALNHRPGRYQGKS